MFDKAISITVDYGKDRKAFGKSVLDNQVINHKMCELAIEVEALRALSYQAVGKLLGVIRCSRSDSNKNPRIYCKL